MYFHRTTCNSVDYCLEREVSRETSWCSFDCSTESLCSPISKNRHGECQSMKSKMEFLINFNTGKFKLFIIHAVQFTTCSMSKYCSANIEFCTYGYSKFCERVLPLLCFQTKLVSSRYQHKTWCDLIDFSTQNNNMSKIYESLPCFYSNVVQTTLLSSLTLVKTAQ